MGYADANSKKIDMAFKKSVSNVNESIRRGMEGLLDDGAAFCLLNHDATHQRHLKTGDSYGWILIHDGTEINRKVISLGVEATSNANAALDKVRSGCPSTGWVGIVLAGMLPENYFSIKYEAFVMRGTIGDLKHQNFNKYFKPL